MFKSAGLGAIVGTRTMGAGIGAALDQPHLIDGGILRIPNRAAFNPVGSWDIENHGVEPDSSVSVSVEAWLAGSDRQLEIAVEKALEALETHAPRKTRLPDYPIHPRGR